MSGKPDNLGGHVNVASGTGQEPQPVLDADVIREALEALCLDSLETPLDVTLNHEGEVGHVDALFRTVVPALDRLVARVNALERENEQLRGVVALCAADTTAADLAQQVEFLKAERDLALEQRAEDRAAVVGRGGWMDTAIGRGQQIERLVERVQTLERALEHVSWIAVGLMAARAVVLEGAAGNAVVEPKEKDTGGLASKPRGTEQAP